MDVKIKEFKIEMDVKNNGIELEVNNGKRHIGDCIANKTGLIWCEGKTHKKNGTKISWEELNIIGTSPETLEAAVKSARKVKKDSEDK
jgi:hypothetical protein